MEFLWNAVNMARSWMLAGGAALLAASVFNGNTSLTVLAMTLFTAYVGMHFVAEYLFLNKVAHRYNATAVEREDGAQVIVIDRQHWSLRLVSSLVSGAILFGLVNYLFSLGAAASTFALLIVWFGVAIFFYEVGRSVFLWARDVHREARAARLGQSFEAKRVLWYEPISTHTFGLLTLLYFLASHKVAVDVTAQVVPILVAILVAFKLAAQYVKWMRWA